MAVDPEVTPSETNSQSSSHSALILAHLDKVAIVARLLVLKLPPQFEWKELAQVGVLAMIEAAPRYRPESGTFWTFMYLRVRGAMIDFCEDGCHADPADVELVSSEPGVSMSAQFAGPRLHSALNQFSVRDRGIFEALGQGYRAREIAGMLGISEARVSQIRKRARERLRSAA